MKKLQLIFSLLGFASFKNTMAQSDSGNIASFIQQILTASTKKKSCREFLLVF